MMFDLDETVETRNSMAESGGHPKTAANLNNSNYSTSSQRSHSNESTHGPDSFYSVGKALSLSMALAGPDGKSPSRRSSHTSHASSAQSQAGITSTGGSPTASSRAAHHAHQNGADRINRTDFLMWESGFCSKLGIRESQEDRFSCQPNINSHIRGASSSGAGADGGIGVAPSAMIGGGEDGAGAYFGVYDGHGGQAAAVYLEKYLLDNICVHPLFSENLQQAVVESCIQTDKNFLVSWM